MQFEVTREDTAIALGSGDVEVLATPRLLAWCEMATTTELELAETQTSVGTRVSLEHLLASPVGARVSVAATVEHRDGRLVRFAVTAHDDRAGGRLIATAEITRVVIDRGRFLDRLPD
jgi:predicted thioesterase